MNYKYIPTLLVIVFASLIGVASLLPTSVSAATTYYCNIVWQSDVSGNHQYDGFYFGCSTDPLFNPKEAVEDGDLTNAVQCLNYDDGDCKIVGEDGYNFPSVGADTVKNSRTSWANSNCGVGNWTLSGNEYAYATDYICSSAPQFIDIGLRINEGTPSSPIIQAIAIENPSGTLTSPLHIAKNGITYRVALVNVGDANATKALIRLANGDIKALRKF